MTGAELPPVRLGQGGPVVGHVTAYDLDTGEIALHIDDDRAAKIVRGNQLDGLSIDVGPADTVNLADLVPVWHATDITDDLTRLTPRPTPDGLRRLADAIESRECTGVAASWCPVHGTCVCHPRGTVTFNAGIALALNDPACPLHGPTSTHGAQTADTDG